MLTVGDHTFDGICIVPNADKNAGFGALITFALNGVRAALLRNLLPVIDFDADSTHRFYDPACGESIWEYYFEPVMGLSSADAYQLRDEGVINEDRFFRHPEADIWHWHHTDPDRIATFWHVDKPDNPAEWITRKRALGRRFVRDYVRPLPEIPQQVEELRAARFTSAFKFGVHIRGTDFAYAEPTTPAKHIEAIDRTVAERALDDWQVFVATDQEQFVELFRERFEERLITSPSHRSRTGVAPFKLDRVPAYARGANVLQDLLLLSRCDFLLKGASSLGEIALWFNPHLECMDFALTSEADTRYYVHRSNAFLKLNVPRASSLGLYLRQAWLVIGQYFEYRVLKFDPLRRRVRRAWDR